MALQQGSQPARFRRIPELQFAGCCTGLRQVNPSILAPDTQFAEQVVTGLRWLVLIVRGGLSPGRGQCTNPEQKGDPARPGEPSMPTDRYGHSRLPEAPICK